MNINKNKYFNKLILTIVLIQTLLFPTISLAVNQETNTSTKQNNYTIPGITADAYYVMDNKTNKVLYKHNENKKMYPASTTKILTAIIVLENTKLEDKVTADYNSLIEIPEGYSVANIQYDETLTVEQLLELLLIPSCNDVANVLAVHVGGSIESFVSMMNTKVHDLGLTNTHFTSPYGKHDENHYTTAYELSKIFQYCIKNTTFRQLTSKATCTIPATNKSEIRTYESTNKLIIPGNPNHYGPITCGKTGYTTPAKQCLVSSSYHNDIELISTILGSTDRFNDTKKIYNKSYSNYSLKNIVNKNQNIKNITITNGTNETKNLNLIAENNINILLPNSIDINKLKSEITYNEKQKAPIYKNDILGKITYTIDDTKYETNLIASHDVKKSNTINYILYTISFLIISYILYYLYKIINIQIITNPNYLLEEHPNQDKENKKEENQDKEKSTNTNKYPNENKTETTNQIENDIKSTKTINTKNNEIKNKIIDKIENEITDELNSEKINEEKTNEKKANKEKTNQEENIKKQKLKKLILEEHKKFKTSTEKNTKKDIKKNIENKNQ